MPTTASTTPTGHQFTVALRRACQRIIALHLRALADLTDSFVPPGSL
jgi:hypothetical protein